MPKFHVTIDGAVPTGTVIEAADERAALAQFCEDLKDWADQVTLRCEEIDDAGAQAAIAARLP